MILINIDAAFVFLEGWGGSLVFMQPVTPLFYICFITFFVQSRNSVIFVFSFLVENLIVSVSFVPSISFLHGRKGRWKGSHCCMCFIIPFYFFKKKDANKGVEGFPLLWFFFFNFILIFFLWKRISRWLQGQKPQVLGAFLWGINCIFFCEELGTKAALLSSASRLCQNLNAQSDGRIYPWGLLVPPPPGGWKEKNVTELSLKQTIKPRALNVIGSAVFNVSVFSILKRI